MVKKQDTTKSTISEKDAIQKVSEYRIISETNIVSILWKNPELYLVYDELTIDTFKNNKCKVFYQIGYDIVVKERKTLEPITIAMYLEKHSKLAEKYDQYGGYDIMATCEYVDENNLESYIEEINKWNVLLKLYKEGFPIAEKLNEYVDMSCEDIYDEKEAILNHIFLNTSGKDKSYKIGYKIDELIDNMDEGLEVGLPYYNMPLFTQETSGILPGNMYLYAGLSGTGKSSFIRNAILPSVIETGETLVLMINEEDLQAIQKNLIVFVANNIYKKDVQKYKLKNGGYSQEFKKFLKEACAKWIKDHEHQIIVIPFSSYSCSKAIKVIRKYSAINRGAIFVLDTFKASSDATGDTWKSAMDDSIKLYDTIKSANLNVPLLVTAQLNKSSASRSRALNQADLALSKSIIDVCSMACFMRQVGQDEMPDGKNELKVFAKGGKNGLTKVPVTLDAGKHYIVGTFAKNRFGSTDLSIVFEHDLSRNTISEVGYCICVDNMI